MYQKKKIGVIIAAAGSGNRMGGGISKQFRIIEGMPVLSRAVAAFDSHPMVDEILVVTKEDSLEFCEKEMIAPYGFRKVAGVTAGGKTRQDSVYRGLLALSADTDFVLIHDGARPFISGEVITETIATVYLRRAAVVAVPVKDTIKMVRVEADDEGRKSAVFHCTPDRAAVYAVQTPQAFAVPLLREAMDAAFSEKFYGTDDSVLVERMGKKVYLVKGDHENIKITTAEDMEIGAAIARRQLLRQDAGGMTKERGGGMNRDMQNTPPWRAGTGYDVHRLTEGRRLILGGVEIPWEKGLLGHSDADVLLHAIMDALLGAAALGDIGRHFPDKDDAYKDISSLALLSKVGEMLSEKGYGVGNIDAVVIAQQPKIAPFIPAMTARIAEVLGICEDQINIKATTTEELGFCGRGEGIASQAAALICRQEAL